MKRYLALAVIVLAGIIPFASRAVFMDEHIFLQIAENAQHNWLFPQDTPGVFFGIPVANFAAHTHPPVGEYYLAGVYALLGGFSEVPFRLAFSIFPIAAVLAFYYLATRFTRQPFEVALIFALSPAFLVMTPTLMMDTPALAFLLVGFALYFAHLDGRKHTLPVAGICFVLAAGTGYTVLVPLACLLIQMGLATRPRKEMLAVVAAPAALVVWQTVMTTHFGTVPVAGTVGFYADQMGALLHKIGATLGFLGTLAIFPWSIVVLMNRSNRKVIISLLAVGAGLALIVGPWFAFGATSGLLLLLEFARCARKIIGAEDNRGEAVFIAWLPATVVFFIVVADMINARYILLSLPALYLVLFRDSSRRQLIGVMVPTAVLSICLAYADFTFVNAYRSWVAATVVPLQTQGFKVWSASESGLRFYLQREGSQPLTMDDLRPRGTDLVVQHDLFRYSLSADVATMLIPISRTPLNSAFPLRTFSRESQAGFHDSRIGLMPFQISRVPLDHVDISEMSPLVLGLPQRGISGEDVPAWSPKGPILKQSQERREFKVKIPAHTKLEYELEGDGQAETGADGIILRRRSPGTIVWRNLRLVPFQE